MAPGLPTGRGLSARFRPTPRGAFQFGGVNGGTIRAEGVPNLTVRVVAFGEQGAFGEPRITWISSRRTSATRSR